MSRVTLKLTISGRVQGVSYRVTMKEKAGHHRVDGWVRNARDGSVEALIQGEEEHVWRLVEWAREGPSGARVSSVTHQKLESYPKQTGFRVVP